MHVLDRSDPSFIAALAEAGVAVTTTCVARPGADAAGVRQLSEALGALECKTRDWHA